MPDEIAATSTKFNNLLIVNGVAKNLKWSQGNGRANDCRCSIDFTGKENEKRNREIRSRTARTIERKRTKRRRNEKKKVARKKRRTENDDCPAATNGWKETKNTRDILWPTRQENKTKRNNNRQRINTWFYDWMLNPKDYNMQRSEQPVLLFLLCFLSFSFCLPLVALSSFVVDDLLTLFSVRFEAIEFISFLFCLSIFVVCCLTFLCVSVCLCICVCEVK